MNIECAAVGRHNTDMSPQKSFPAVRLTPVNHAPVNARGAWVLYWMIAARRTRFHFGLERAVAWANELGKPLVILEALRAGYRWACDRFHRFILDGMADQAQECERQGVLYYPYLEPEPGAGKGLLRALAERACVVVSDDFPAFFLPRMVAAAAGGLPVLLETVDANGLLPLRAAPREFQTARAFRSFLQKTLPEHLARMPAREPLKRLQRKFPPPRLDEIFLRWPPAGRPLLQGGSADLAWLPIDHGVGIVGERGGQRAALRRLRNFLRKKLARYPEGRNHPDDDMTSGLSAYLHFGHISPHEIFAALVRREHWSLAHLGQRSRGSRTGWWGMSVAAEAFLDQLVIWRELGFNRCCFRRDYDRYESLPAWARQTLEKHLDDVRPYLYRREHLEQALTHDPVWNAAQRQLVREGRLHNYLRMLWGKKILEWAASPREALELMIELNNRYALDGRDPNSYSGIFWTLGLYDRPWGPERPVFGTVRYMSSPATLRKLRLKNYLKTYSPGDQPS